MEIRHGLIASVTNILVLRCEVLNKKFGFLLRDSSYLILGLPFKYANSRDILMYLKVDDA